MKARFLKLAEAEAEEAIVYFDIPDKRAALLRT
jgi:hypothetical protein